MRLKVSIPSKRGNVPDELMVVTTLMWTESQSPRSGAMFLTTIKQVMLDTGEYVSIPSKRGNVPDWKSVTDKARTELSLNPLEAGQCS